MTVRDITFTCYVYICDIHKKRKVFHPWNFNFCFFGYSITPVGFESFKMYRKIAATKLPPGKKCILL